MCFQVPFVQSISLVFAVYWPQDYSIAMIEKIAKMDGIIIFHPSATIHICADTNLHHNVISQQREETNRENVLV